MPIANIKSRLAEAWARAGDIDSDSWPAVVIMQDERITRHLQAGYVALRANVPGAVSVVLPDLLPTAPMAVQRRYVARVLASSIGTCPLCHGVAGVSGNPEHPAAWHLLPVTVEVKHEPWCAALFTERDRQHFVLWAGERS